ncbi:hypothetical protein NXG15_29730, partial [Klebsiella pneumoniae]|nr:hypothetical protein [Klebsiella pneumoniae]
MNNIASIARPGAAPATAAVGCVTTCIAVASVYLMQPVMAEVGSVYGVTPSDARLAFSAASIA